MRRFITRHFIPLVTIIFITLLLSRGLWATRAVPDTHDGIYHVVRMAELWEMIKGGQFPVRWASNLDGGYGLPLFNYIYPLPYYLGLPIVAAGFSPFWAVKLITVISFLLGGIGMYVLGSKNKLLGFVGAILFLTAPYQLVNIFVRGALGEVLAVSLIPWVIWAGLDLQSQRLRWYHPIPIALLLLSHTFLSYLFIPIYLVIVYRRDTISRHFTSLLLSIGISGWYIIPSVLESNLLSSVVNLDFTFRYFDHFVYPIQLLWSKWGLGYSQAGLNDGISFQLGIANILALITSTYFVFKSNKLRTFWLIMISILLMIPYSKFIWDILRPLQSIQFPWRLLFLPTFLIPYQYISSGSKSKITSVVICLIALGFGIYFAHPRYPQNESQYMLQWYGNRTGTTTSSKHELMPKWVSGDQSDNYLPYHYFPTWKLTDSSGKNIPIYPSSTGQIDYDRSIVTGDVNLSIHQTNLEIISNIVTVISLIIILKLMFI